MIYRKCIGCAVLLSPPPDTAPLGSAAPLDTAMIAGIVLGRSTGAPEDAMCAHHRAAFDRLTESQAIVARTSS